MIKVDISVSTMNYYYDSQLLDVIKDETPLYLSPEVVFSIKVKIFYHF